MPESGRVVVIDTSVWVDFLRGGRSREATAVEELVRSARAVTCGIVLAELLAGVKNAEQRERLSEALAGLDYVEMREQTWKRAGDLAAGLRSKGRTLPMSDLIVAAVALEHDLSVFTGDNHFHHIPGLRLHPD
jgi:predicted nucleic acid-binding protein